MKIIVYGAGAIGSLFGALLASHHDVILIGRHDHVETINNKGLHIRGCTHLDYPIQAEETLKNLGLNTDIIQF